MIIGPKFPRHIRHKTLAELAMETGDPNALVLFVNPNSRIPYRVQLVLLWIKHFVFKRPL